MAELNYKLCHENAHVPVWATAGSAGYDLFAVEDTCIMPRMQKKVKTGIQIQLPVNTCAKIESRSSMVLEEAYVMGGVIDQDYRGEIMVIITNWGTSDVYLEAGDRIAQMIIHKIVHPTFQQSFELAGMKRDGGFGSTGKGLIVKKSLSPGKVDVKKPKPSWNNGY